MSLLEKRQVFILNALIEIIIFILLVLLYFSKGRGRGLGVHLPVPIPLNEMKQIYRVMTIILAHLIKADIYDETQTACIQKPSQSYSTVCPELQSFRMYSLISARGAFSESNLPEQCNLNVTPIFTIWNCSNVNNNTKRKLFLYLL